MTVEKFPHQPAPSLTEEQEYLRLECLKAANETAKLGLSHNVYQTAERYVAWVKGEKLEDPNEGLDFRQRLEGLVSEFLREERSDARRIMNDVAEWFSQFERLYPEPKSLPSEETGYSEILAQAADAVWPVAKPRNGILEQMATADPVLAADVDAGDVIRMQHRDIRS